MRRHLDITQLILDDHHEQRRLFAILEQIDRSDTETLTRHLGAAGGVPGAARRGRGGDLLPRVAPRGQRAAGAGVEEETLDAIHDHNDIRDAVAAVADHEVEATDGMRPWRPRTWPTATTWARRSARA